MSSPAAKPEPVEVCYSYSHRDEELRNELEKHLSILKRQGVIKGWHDRKIGAGREWEGEIDEHFNSAGVILLLVSADFLDSDYCYDVEMKRAMERHEAGEARVIPVMLRSVDWKGAPFRKLQVLPTDAKPVTSWRDRDEAFTNVASGIRVAIEELTKSKSSKTPSSAGTESVAATKASGLPSIWNVPHNRNVNFTGREEQLANLRKTLTSGRPAAVTGLGGVGKTQLAVECTYRHAAEYSIVWWVRAEEPAKLAADYAALAAKLKLEEKDEKDQRIIIEAVKAWLGRNTGWLIIFDNAQEPRDVRPYLPHGATGHVLVTSRNPNWGGTAESLSVKSLPRDDAVEFLLKRTGQQDKDSARRLAQALGDLPLALEQAGAYMEETGKSLSDYFNLFQTRQKELLARGRPSTEYPATVAKTWDIAFQEAQNRSAAAADLMNLCAFLAPDDIPLSLLVEGKEHLPESLAKVAADPLKLDDAVAVLRRYSLAGRSGDCLSVHRLVQAVACDRLPEDRARVYAEAAVGIVNRAFPFDSDDVRTWPVCSRLLSHALAAASHAERLTVVPETVARLLSQVGLYLQGRAQFPQAKTVQEQALVIGEAAYGPNHPNVASMVNNLGLVLLDLGDLPAARKHFERALAIDEATYGPNHPNVANRLNSLAGVLEDLGDLPAARKHLERALAIDEATYGPNHPKVATGVNNLGSVLQELGDLGGARKHFERALAIDETTYGPNHPKVAICVNNLGLALKYLNDLPGARKHYERALAIDEAAYGPNHPSVAICVNNLGLVLQDMGDLPGAHKHFERALAIDEAAYGPNHPKVAIDVNNLGGVLRALGDLPAARKHLERALAIDEAAYGPNHPRVASTVNNLGGVLRALGDLPGARKHLEQALRIFQQFLGDDHPQTQTVRRNLESLPG